MFDQLVVYICGYKGSKRSSVLNKYFQGAKVKYVESPNKECSNDLTQELFFMVISDAYSKGYQKILVIHDSSITSSSPEYIKSVISGCLEQNFDLCYLSKYMDLCHLYTNRTALNNGSTLVRSYSPKGIQAVMLTDRCVKILLGKDPLIGTKYFKVSSSDSVCNDIAKCVSDGHLIAIAVVPNIFEYDISLAVKASDYQKTVQCSPVPFDKSVYKSHESLFGSYIVLFILIILIIIGLYLAVRRR